MKPAETIPTGLAPLRYPSNFDAHHPRAAYRNASPAGLPLAFQYFGKFGRQFRNGGFSITGDLENLATHPVRARGRNDRIYDILDIDEIARLFPVAINFPRVPAKASRVNFATILPLCLERGP